MEINRGNIFYDAINNLYLVVTTCIYTDRVRYVCMVFDGYKTDHKYLDSKIVTYNDLNNEKIYNQVDGIY